ncbi:unnamed protein product [Ectocarpus sp. 12 AP-2014]
MVLPLFLPCCVHCYADRLPACPTNRTPWWAWARDAKNNRVRVCFRALFLRTCARTTYSSPARFRSIMLRLPVATASVTLPIGQTVTKDEYRLACENSMGDTTVGETSLHDGKLVSIDRVNFSVEAMVTAKATSLKTGFQQDVSYPAAFFMTIDLRTNKLAEVRMYAQNIALLAARGYTMIPSSSYGPVIRPV